MKVKRISSGKMDVNFDFFIENIDNNVIIKSKIEEKMALEEKINKQTYEELKSEYNKIIPNRINELLDISEGKIKLWDNKLLADLEWISQKDPIFEDCPCQKDNECCRQASEYILGDTSCTLIIKGYMVYKSLLKEGPFVQKNSEPENMTSFIDSVSMKMSNKYIYYKIKAFDNRFNPSEFSELLILKKPDIIPPLAPKITNYIATQNTILLKWVNSEIDEDIEKTKIYRLKKGDENWILLAELKDINITQYEDSDLEENQYYDYKIISVDDSNLESRDSKIVKIKTKKILIQKPITGFRFYKLIHQKGIKLEWKYDKEVMYYDIYKKIGNQPTNKIYSTYKKEYIDSTYKDGLDYEYSVRAFLKDGSISEINKLIVK